MARLQNGVVESDAMIQTIIAEKDVLDAKVFHVYISFQVQWLESGNPHLYRGPTRHIISLELALLLRMERQHLS